MGYVHLLSVNDEFKCEAMSSGYEASEVTENMQSVSPSMNTFSITLANVAF